MLHFVCREICTHGVWHMSEIISEKLHLWLMLFELLVHHRIYDLSQPPQRLCAGLQSCGLKNGWQGSFELIVTVGLSQKQSPPSPFSAMFNCLLLRGTLLSNLGTKHFNMLKVNH